jgi:hypothetical protein
MAEELGKASLAILMVLALLVSIISTFMVLDSMEQPQPRIVPVKVTQGTEGSVSLSIARSADMPVAKEASVSLSIQR